MSLERYFPCLKIWRRVGYKSGRQGLRARVLCEDIGRYSSYRTLNNIY